MAALLKKLNGFSDKTRPYFDKQKEKGRVN
jgi:hypothetical protein